jgi:hypothetical protein
MRGLLAVRAIRLAGFVAGVAANLLSGVPLPQMTTADLPL